MPAKDSAPPRWSPLAIELYRIVLDEGGWWTSAELAERQQTQRHSTVGYPLLALSRRGHVKARIGKSGLVEWGVTTACLPLPAAHSSPTPEGDRHA